MKPLLKSILASVIMISMIGCSTLVTIDSEPRGADLYINNKKVGQTPYSAKLDDLVSKEYHVILKKEGYKDCHGVLEKEIKIGALIGGVLILVPFLWCYGPAPFHNYILQEDKDTAAAIINNNQSQFTITLDNRELALGQNVVEPGTHKVSYFKDGKLVASGNYTFKGSESYAFSL